MSGIDWMEAAERGFVLVNAPARKVAVFANQSGEVAIVSAVDGVEIVTPVDLDEALRLVALLRDAIDDAAPIARHMEAQYAAFNAIEDARIGKASV